MNQRSTAGNRRGGFTILELLIVVSMIAILATLSIGKSSRILTGWRVTRAAQAMSEELQQGFALVGRNRKPLVIEFRTDSMTLYMKDRSGKIFRRRYFGPFSEYKLAATDLQFSMLPGTPSTSYTLEVYPPGLAADSLSIVITRPGTARRIRMLRGGLVQVCPTGDKTKC